jgi:hypothetical protein
MINKKQVHIDIELFKLCFNSIFSNLNITNMCENGIHLNVQFYNIEHKYFFDYTYLLPNTQFDNYKKEIQKKIRFEKLKRILY